MRLLLFTKNIKEYQVIISQFKLSCDFYKIIFPKNHYNKNDKKYKSFVEEIKLFKPDIIISYFYNKYIGSEIINCANYAFNYHPSLLPNYKGAHAINWQIINGEIKTGVTIHKLSDKIDSGDILLQESFEIKFDDDVNNVLEKAIILSISLTKKLFLQLKLDECVYYKQIIIGDEFTCKLRKPEHGELKNSMTDNEIYNMIRALVSPWPGAYYYKNEKDKIVINNMIPYNDIKKFRNKIVKNINNGEVNI